jgi:hypothetical protein
MLEICIQTYDQNVQLILKSYLPVVYGTPLKLNFFHILLMLSGMALNELLPSHNTHNTVVLQQEAVWMHFTNILKVWIIRIWYGVWLTDGLHIQVW